MAVLGLRAYCSSVRIPTLLAAALLTACPPEPGSTPDSPPEELPEPLEFAGIYSAVWDGEDGLIATWDAGTGEGELTYVVTLEGVETDRLEVVETQELTAAVSDLEDGEYRLWVEAVDALGDSTGEGVVLTQLVGANRLVYRSETPIGGFGGPGGGADVWGEDHIVVQAGYRSDTSFMVVDATDPANPEVLTRVSNQGFVKDLKIGDGLLFTNGECGCQLDSPEWEAYDKIGARIFDFSDPANPTLLGTISEPSTSVHNLSYGEGVLYLSDNVNNTVAAWDVKEPTTPTLLWSWSPPEEGHVHDQAWVDGKLYVAFWNGFAVLDVSEPTDGPVEEVVAVPANGGAFHNVWPSDDGSYVFTSEERPGGFLRVWDLSAPEQSVGGFVTDPEHVIHNVHVRGDFAYVAWYVDGVVVLDVADPTNPLEVGRYDTLDESLHDPNEGGDPNDPNGDHHGPITFDGAWGIWPFGPHLAIGDMHRGLILADHFPVVVERGETEE